LRERGLIGRDVIWTAQLAHLRRTLNRALAVDSAGRQRRRSWPIAAEARFGRNGVPGLTVPLPTQGEVTFAGTVDRVDVTENGELVVLDYKTGKGVAYQEIPRPGKAKPDHDLTDRGRKLQLVLYALAARQLHDMAHAPADAYYWFVELGEDLRGSTIAEPQAQRLRDVLDVVVGGIRHGVFPANPGDEEWRTGRLGWSACTYCPFDRVCPSTRAEQWVSVAEDPAVAGYAQLAAPPGQTP
jgi:ATP-dependent helicase/nuclease subunit B